MILLTGCQGERQTVEEEDYPLVGEGHLCPRMHPSSGGKESYTTEEQKKNTPLGLR